MKHTMTPDQVRLLGGPERLAAIHRQIASEGTAVMSSMHTTPAKSGVYDDDDENLNEDSSPGEFVTAAQRHLKKYLAAPDADDADNRIGLASAYLSTALAKRARTSQQARARRW